MSGLHQRLWAQINAQKAFEKNSRELEQDIGMRVPVRFLELRVALMEELVEKTGGSVLTTHYRVTLSDLKKRVTLRSEEHRRHTSRTSLRVVTP